LGPKTRIRAAGARFRVCRWKRRYGAIGGAGSGWRVRPLWQLRRPSDDASGEGVFGAKKSKSSRRGSVSGVLLEMAVGRDTGAW
jgi:hypothetical protein